ncbi:MULTISPECIES: hypothetical protein [Alphaproteobacteria]|uniref:hypothetical protein n=1 Tax=Donghicola TaxID=393277 RepID=UPI001D15B7BF|nr:MULTISPECIES: hypothetical protein [Donghicola]
MIFDPLMLCDAETVFLLAPFDPDPTCEYKGTMDAFDWRQGLPVARSVNGQQSDHGTMPLWRRSIPHIRRVRELFPVPLFPLPQGQRLGPFGKLVFVHCQNHLGLRRSKHQDVSSPWYTPHEELLL